MKDVFEKSADASGFIELCGICKDFNAGTIDAMTLFDGFSFRAKKGSFVSIVGSNGSGKTSLLNILCGSYAPEAGQIFVGGRNITALPEYRRAAFIGRVFQDPKAGTCSELTITENMALFDNKGKLFGLGAGVNAKKLDYYKELVAQCGMGLENRMGTKVGSLSGGQRQALALVIANMAKPELLILDEHTAALDPKTSETIMELTDKFVRERQVTTLMVTHNLRFALEYGDRLVMMHAGGIVLDKEGEEKKATRMADILKIFNEISIECGN